MKKFAFAVLVLAFLAPATSASAQIRWGYVPESIEGWYYLVQGNRVGMLMADELAMVRRMGDQYRRARIRTVVSDFGWNEEARMYGLSNPRGFFPMYNEQMRPLPPNMRQRIERGAGIVMVVDGIRRAAINPRSPWGWVEAAAGAVLTNDSRYRGEPKAPRGEILMEDDPQAQMSAGQKPPYSDSGKPPYPADQSQKPEQGGVYQQAPPVLTPQRVFSEEDLRNRALAKKFYGRCLERITLLEELSNYDLTPRDIKSIVRGSVYINMWESDLVLTAKDGSLDQCTIDPGQERVFLLPAGNTGVNALVRLYRNGSMLPITGDHMEWVSLGSGSGWIIGPKCEEAPCRQ